MFSNFNSIRTDYFFNMLFIMGGTFPKYGIGNALYELLLSALECCTVFCTVFGFVVSSVNLQTIDAVFRMLLVACMALNSFYKHWTIKYFRHPLREFVQNFRSIRLDIFINEAAANAEKSFAKIFAKIAKILVVTYACMLSYILLVPYFANINNYENQRYYIITSWFKCPDAKEERKHSWTLPCWKVDNYANFVLLNAVGLLKWFSQQAITTAVLLLYTLVRQYLEAQEELLQCRLDHLISKMNIIRGGAQSTIWSSERLKLQETEMRKDLANLIAHYQFVRR